MSRLLKNNAKSVDIFSEYKQLIRFNLLCLIKSLPLLISSIFFYLIPIIFVLATHFTNNNLASISWIYLLVIGFFQIVFVNIGIFILYFLNRSNSVDVFFLTKGFKRSSLVISKFLSVLIIVALNSLISTVVMIILLASTGYIHLLLSFSMMQFFGNILTSLFIFPIFLGFSLIKNNIVYFVLSIIFFLLPAASIAPRMQENNISQIEKFSNIETSYAKLYNYYTKNTIAFETVGLSRDDHQFNSLLWSFLPAELMFSPLYYTYQVNNNYISNSLSIDLDFMSSINNVVFESTNYKNNDPFMNSIAIRALDDNIFELSDSDIKKRINNALNNVYNYVYSQTKDATNVFFNKASRWYEGNAGTDPILFEKMLHKMFLDKDTTLFYVYRTIQLNNMSDNSTDSVYHEYAEKYQKILGSLNNSSSSFQNFINSSFKVQEDNNKKKKNTILDYDETLQNSIKSVYPVFNITKNQDASVNINDLDLFLTKYIKTKEIESGYWTLVVKAQKSENDGMTPSNPFNPTRIDIKKFIEWFQTSSYKDDAKKIFSVKESDNSLFYRYINDKKTLELAEKYSITNLEEISNWNSIITENFILCLGGQPQDGISVNGNLALFESFINGLKQYINLNPEQEYWSKIASVNDYNKIQFSLDNFTLNQNTSNLNFAVQSYGKIHQNPYSNLLVSSLVFLSISLIVFVWILYNTIESNKRDSKKE